MSESLELLVRQDPDGEPGTRLLCAPSVGTFTQARPPGVALTAGEEAGVLLQLGRAYRLTVPAGVAGRVASDLPERVHTPVGYGAALYRLSPLGDLAEIGGAGPESGAEAGSAALAIRAPHAGRFWLRPAPGEDPFLVPGDVIEAGKTIGLIEVMKTFTQLPYQPVGDLPERARVVRVVPADGDEVRSGDVLVELESA